MAKCEHNKRFIIEIHGCLACKFIEATQECKRLHKALIRLKQLATDLKEDNIRLKAALHRAWQDYDSPKAEKTWGVKKAA